MTKISVVILAAGKGTRMYSETPKVLHHIADKAMLAHVLDRVADVESTTSVVVYGHGGEQVPRAMQQYAAKFVLQEPQLGTGHAVQQALPKLDEDGKTLILYGDVPLIQTETITKMIAADADLVVLTVTLPEPHGYGRILRDGNGNVLQIVEEKDATQEQKLITEVNTGIMLVATKHLKRWLANLKNENAQGEYYLTDIVAMAAQEKVKINTTQPAHTWEVEGVNNKTQLASLERVFQQDNAKRLMQSGVTLKDPDRIDVRGGLICGKDVEIDVGCIFEGAVQLGDRVKVGAYSIIKNAHIAEEVIIQPYSHIDGATIGASSHIGPYARLRPGTELSDGVHIGNFVEVKNSQIGSNSKANHLSYIGDSTVGSRVNIGAGTITCNYDGANKHRTIIGNNVFVGSDTQLVAPVVINDGATIGAGSTITKDTPANELTLSRSKQITVTGWKRPTKGK